MPFSSSSSRHSMILLLYLFLFFSGGTPPFFPAPSASALVLGPEVGLDNFERRLDVFFVSFFLFFSYRCPLAPGRVSFCDPGLFAELTVTMRVRTAE